MALPPGGRRGRENDLIAGVMEPGDVLFVQGSPGGLWELGTNGGLMGHVMLVTEPPEKIELDTDEAHHLQLVWPAGASRIWKVRTVESTRANKGLHEALLLLHVASDSSRLVIIGELGDGTVEISGETAEVWQSPEPLRARLDERLMEEVLGEMREVGTSWSWATAARAVFRAPSSFSGGADKLKVLQEIQECWTTDPICTSVVIAFWQRVLCRAAGGDADDFDSGAAADLVLMYFPLKADRSLPGALLTTMSRCGWTRRTAVPKAEEPARKSECANDEAGARRRSRSVPAARRPAVREAAPEAPAKPVYCRAHDTREKRRKVDPRLKECQGCSVQVCSNYEDFSLCPSCSDRDQKCLCCGISTLDTPPKPAPPPRRAAPGKDASQRMSGAPDVWGVRAPLVIGTWYCAAHDSSEKRVKVGPQLRECAACHLKVQTTYEGFELCGPCAEKEHRCMICGSDEAPAAVQQLQYEASSGSPLATAQQLQSPGAGWKVVPPPPSPLNLAAGAQSPLGAQLPNPLQTTMQKLPTVLPSPGGAALTASAPPTPSSSVPPRFCPDHDASDKRAKVDSTVGIQVRECTSCHIQVNTTYVGFELCGSCSDAERRCMICGTAAPKSGRYIPPERVPTAHGPLPQPPRQCPQEYQQAGSSWTRCRSQEDLSATTRFAPQRTPTAGVSFSWAQT